MTTSEQLTYRAIRRYLRWGILLVGVTVFGVGGWAATTEISGAVISQGTLVIDSNVKKVQHQTGGTVERLLVGEGDHVSAGDVVIRLDGTQTRASLSIASNNLDQLLARRSRLEAERDDAASVKFPKALAQKPPNTTTMEPTRKLAPLGLRPSVQDQTTVYDATQAVITEQKLFNDRRHARDGLKAQLDERIAQLREEILGYEGQARAKDRELALLQKELVGVQELWGKNLVSISRVSALERDAARIDGERSRLLGDIAQAKGKISEIQLQLLQVDRDLRTEVGKDLAEVQSKISELMDRKLALEDQLEHLDIRAPLSGRVLQLAVHSVGAVIVAGEAAMVIVPDQDKLTAEVKISPLDINQVSLGQRALLKFLSFNQRTTPEMVGHVSLISADLSQDQRTGTSYYMVRVSPVKSELAHLPSSKLVPGMPVEVFIETDKRTVLSYLTKPLRDQASRAFTEQ